MARAAIEQWQREQIGEVLGLNRMVEWTPLAALVGLHRSSVQREVDRNGGRWFYRAGPADERAARCRRRPRQRLVEADPVLRERLNHLVATTRFSPAAAAAELAREPGRRVCAETIYQAVYAGLLDTKPAQCLRRRRTRRRGRQTRHQNNRPRSSTIALRPETVNDRSEPGHWEADSVLGAYNRSAVVTLIERVTRYAIVVDLPNGHTAADTLAALVHALEQIPAHLRLSITFDQGSERAEHETLAATYGLKIWFCDPHSPWQRGAIEHLNGLVRYWLPRGTNLANIPTSDLNHINWWLNNQRRHSLHWDTPAERYNALTAH